MLFGESKFGAVAGEGNRRSLKPELLHILEDFINNAKKLPRRKLEFKTPPRHSPIVGDLDFSIASVTEMSKGSERNENLQLENERANDAVETDSTISLRGADVARYRAWLASQEINVDNNVRGQRNGLPPYIPPLVMGNTVGGNGAQDGY
ncbi:hypothetical protein CASFOL_036603 [Castilleja foliolosa]|uniref:Uncharacterized protein n=1 Tax=Castilleja foliolosa TaxID=1961234 RepID=A0ABD3BQK8_9LAMI